MFLNLFWDIGLSLAAYYGLRAMGASPYVALLGGTVTAGLRIAYVWLRTRRLDGFAAFMLAEFVLGLGLAFVTGDARFLVAKDSLIFLATCVIGRPMVWQAAARFQPAARAELERQWDTDAGFRRAFRILTLVWGAGLLAESVARVVVAYTLPVDAAAGLSLLLRLGTTAVLVLWTLVAVKRRRAGRP
jgi:intracellular septation protein A